MRGDNANRYVSRSIDLDILYYGETVLHEETLTLPHPRLHLRRFALLPMCEVAPDFVHPVLHRTQTELLAQCPDQSIVKCLKNSKTTSKLKIKLLLMIGKKEDRCFPDGVAKIIIFVTLCITVILP